MKTILVVDDDPMMRDVMAKVLEREGYKVFKHNMAINVEALMKSSGADLLLTDHDLGQYSDTGLVLAERIKKLGYGVVIMSGNYDAEPGANLLDIPFHLKTAPMAELLAMIEEAGDDGTKD